MSGHGDRTCHDVPCMHAVAAKQCGVPLTYASLADETSRIAAGTIRCMFRINVLACLRLAPASMATQP
jgi:hypothetical protein